MNIIGAVIGKAQKVLQEHPMPRVAVTVDGVDISGDVADRLIDLNLTDNRGFEADTLEIRLDDSDGRLGIPPLGAEVAVAIGWDGQPLVDKGTFTVDEASHEGMPDVLTVVAKSADLRSGIATQRERSFHGKTVGDIVRIIAGENELAAMVAESIANQVIDHIDQTNESSANFLTRLADLFDAFATVKRGKLLFMPAASGLSVSGKPLGKVSITRQDGDKHRFNQADRNSYTAVKATYNDLGRAEKGEVIWGKEEDAAESGKEDAAEPQAATGTFKPASKTSSTRARALRLARKEWKAIKSAAERAKYDGVRAPYNDKNLEAAGEVTWGKAEEDKARAAAKRQARKDAAKLDEPAIAPSTDSLKTLRHVYASKAAATRAARTEYRRLKRGMATFNLTLARGRPELITDLPAGLSGWKPQIDNTEWIITRVVHTVSGDGGYTMPVEFEIKATELPE